MHKKGPNYKKNGNSFNEMATIIGNTLYFSNSVLPDLGSLLPGAEYAQMMVKVAEIKNVIKVIEKCGKQENTNEKRLCFINNCDVIFGSIGIITDSAPGNLD